MLRMAGRFSVLLMVLIVTLFSCMVISCGGDDSTDGDNNDGDLTADGDEDEDDNSADRDNTAEYPAAPYGTGLGDTMANLTFKDCDGNEVALSDVYGNASAILINQSAGWCTVCRGEMDTLKSWYDELKVKNIAFVQALNQDNSGSPASEAFCKSWQQTYGVEFYLWIDAEDKLSDYETEDTMPLNIVLNSEMVIQYIITGGAPEEIKTRLTDLAAE